MEVCEEGNHPEDGAASRQQCSKDIRYSDGDDTDDDALPIPVLQPLAGGDALPPEDNAFFGEGPPPPVPEDAVDEEDFWEE